MYGKLENGVLTYSPKQLKKGGVCIYNPTAEMLAEIGYKKVIRDEYPNDGKHYRQELVESDAEIRVVWVDDEADYWENIHYDEAVNAEIRERYSESQEFAILRQKDEKPQEYAEYYAYCEECKARVKERKGMI